MFDIIRYEAKYETELMNLIRKEGEDWKIYWDEPNATRYRCALGRSITYLALADGQVCGYVRALEDALFIYVCDLLVTERFRSNGLGQRLMQRVAADYPACGVYVMSGNDAYYRTLNFQQEGSIYLLK